MKSKWPDIGHKKNWTRALLLALTTSFLLGVLYILFKPHRLIEMKLCIPKARTSALAIIAQERGFFKSEGLSVDITVEALGKHCIESLIARQTDFAISNVSPVVGALTLANPLIVITEVQRSAHYMSIVYHKDKNNKNLIGKKFVLVRGSDGELLLQLFIKAHAEITYSNISVVKTNTMEEAKRLLESKKADAAILWEPYLTDFLTSNPEIYNQEQSPLFTEFALLVSTKDIANAKPEAIDRFTRALFRAQNYYLLDAPSARSYVKEFLGCKLCDTYPEVWSKSRFHLGLSSVLIAIMNQVGSAILMEDVVPAETSQINIMQGLYPQSLRKIGKELVTYE